MELIFISQTHANQDGNYTITWDNDGTTVLTHHNLFKAL